MDDYGNNYQTEAWAYGCEQYGYSIATFGFLDDQCLDFCMHWCIDYAASEV